ncbi:UDP-N-acetylglucosamine--N-acetylmuramyl-(pentapeptide) pyrophosphoryl-undecaprenol N-acetylglucosamine transferase [Rhabdothermincola salaria]|uniref:UDP-N-acetylglucosamine--N-acetylmuramyl- (pentapeptide) pyrophosphoryl-undecaprenol N-acetylglucosamine transferase n=1 Tax=Rhabdothermincola salaria TaxID=2903142 RepID=UPI001E322109|nr:UDP-N-acetylglucosamine--N-acetylmuramyl-(pentapeptide) pyrophosphoryl-undecaprenol N-acetylglucosamine transferase [Rhabdothermincola salaria]MCD9622479.1 UDP-N-acetylglucosamine--N-acetylmuramyl-(pentapeptide) pyrophosphoryl-undecaprenol N-acetylglucosamine transferase [Rhabdothermincola salaria]
MGRRASSPLSWAVVAGGGTAGHVLPGLAVARALVARGRAQDSIHFVGSERGLEARLVPEAGFRITLLPGRGIQRRLTVANIGAIWGLLRAMVEGIALIRRERPAVVVVLGGYASVACVLGAVLWRVPIVVTEQNARAGAANRLAGRFAKACAVPFDETDLPHRVVTGNPVRSEVLAVDRVADRATARAALGLPDDRTVVAVVTGSLGSRRVNDAVWGALPRWAGRGDLAVRHVLGSRDHDAGPPPVPEIPPDGLRYQAVRYEDHMDQVLAAADLLVSRSGGTTVAEVAEVGLASVLVPFPAAPRDHQTANAAPLVRAGAAIMVPDVELDADRLVAVVEPLLDDPDRLASMGTAARSLAHPDAADRVADLVEEHARREH